MDKQIVSRNRRRVRVGEVAGGTAADCAAVCCCAPLTMMNVVVLVAYKVPTGLCRKVIKNSRKREKRLISNQTLKKSLLRNSFDDVPDIAPMAISRSDDHDDVADDDVWNQFHGAGFWRSPSQREAS